MSKSHFNAPHFKDPEAARTYLEALRWGKERVCPHCGTVNHSFATKKPGVYRCGSRECRKDFSVTTKSVMESFFSSLKIERTTRRMYRTRDDAKAYVFDYIERFYNPKRRHSTIGYLSPTEFERQAGLA